MGITQFNDGEIHDVNSLINDEVWVDFESPEKGTTVNIFSSADITEHLRCYEDSQINMYGGSLGNDLYAYGWSHVSVSGGWISDDLFAYDSSQVSVSGGRAAEDLFAYDSSQVDIVGGSIRYSLNTYGSSQIIMSGGAIGDYLYAFESSDISVSGGSIGDDLIAGWGGTITIYGPNFAVDGEDVDYGELTSINHGPYWEEPAQHLTGRLFNGDWLANDFYIGDDSKIILAPPFILTIAVEPNNIGIDTITPSIGSAIYAGWVDITAADYPACPDVYYLDHWEGDVADPNSATTTVLMDSDKTITAVYSLGERVCGDLCHPIRECDLNRDCRVDIWDFFLYVSYWLDCTHPDCD
jgi:hypothetical protein